MELKHQQRNQGRECGRGGERRGMGQGVRRRDGGGGQGQHKFTDDIKFIVLTMY